MLLDKYKVILFDFDDTLVNTREPIWEHHKYVARKYYDIKLTDERLKKHYGEPFEEFIQNLYEHKDSVENMIENYSIDREKFPKILYPDTLSTLNKLIESNKKIGIITATTKEYLMEDLKRLSFPYKQMFHLQGSEETKFNKPDGRVFEPAFEVADQLGIARSEIVYIGDGSKDMKATKDAEIDFIGIAGRTTHEEEFEKQKVKSVSSLSDLLS
ncbi:HAD hydrolase-like protein [Candidatus Dojkabacteria bacterium]|nr:HAD hydrolase-like protein [Candidatus Dojkabacteria bacterium]